jgi:hypothetical protein
MLTNFVLPLSFNFFADMAGKKSLPRQQKVTFYLPHQQKVNKVG